MNLDTPVGGRGGVRLRLENCAGELVGCAYWDTRNRDFLEKLTVAQLVVKFSALYEARIITSVLTSFRHLFLP